MSPLASAMLGDQQRMPPLASMVMANAGPAPSIDAASAPAPADAWSQNASAVQDWIAQQRAQAARMGLWNDQTGLPTQAGVMDAARQYANGMQPATIRAFHGSPYDFSAFDMSKIGTGEGAQAYGHGLYFAGNEGVARSYKGAGQPSYLGADRADAARSLLEQTGGDRQAAMAIADANMRQTTKYSEGKLWQDVVNNFDDIVGRGPGRMYEVNLNVEPGQLLDWDKPLSGQSPQAQDALAKLGFQPGPARGVVPLRGPIQYPEPSGAQIYNRLAGGDIVGKHPQASDTLNQAGIPGIQYLDAGSRAAGDGTRNYVMFDPNLIDIVRKYGLAGAMLGAPAAAPFMPSQAPQQ